MEDEKYSEYKRKSTNREIDSSRKHPNSGECKITPLNLSKFPDKEERKELADRLKLNEHQLFIECLKTYGKDWQKLEKSIPSRTSYQIRNHAKKFFEMIKKQYGAEDPVDFFLKNRPLNIKIESLIKPESLERSQFPTGSTYIKGKDNFTKMEPLIPKAKKSKIRSVEESFRMKLKRSSNEVSFNRSSEEMEHPSKKFFIDR
mmetsp:Transcript_11743/g.11690  ORF Transcript_11743/g.11690 Transcript_11743/m.11690 type:complete len:202 (+) Transcript_11743:357-962(+)|eukprot:CAMPEP_0197000194 /NCGR_PEP_ID=MMETSP1380-20130617/5192_1 /TAXON_ID=5936 /ORGANISM="Euplotes crassus, Strain CT5" /LENGTH=201 /DNA_ID=CAMNT_0042417391 /DNA_START=357 /DNA_END=962 /DNA_ORIENTATION=-